VHIVVYLPLALPLLATVSARWVTARLDPRTATWLLTGSALVLATASGAALALLAATLLGQIPLVALAGHWSAAALRRHDPTSLSLAIIAGLLLVIAVTAALRAAARRVRAFAATSAAARCLPERGSLAILNDPAPSAYAMPGLPGKIVVTAGMLDALDDRERQVLLAHERAHLSGSHFLFTALAQLAAATNPLLRPLAAAVGFSVERWADEHAARITGDRRLVARTIAKAALLTNGHQVTPSAALAMAAGSLRGTGPIPRRVAALLAAPPRQHPLLLGAIVIVLLAASGSAVQAARDLHGLIQLAGGP
jgi:Zn-dependent protease with chaperone function